MRSRDDTATAALAQDGTVASSGGGISRAAEARALADDALERAGLVLEWAHDPARTRTASAVLTEVWGASDTAMIDPALLVAIAHAGNLVAVALVDGEPAGAAVGFCGPPGTPFHSHIVGLLPHSVGRGRGRAIKLAQRAWCLEHGIDAMTWTYDPLVARNAGFNIRSLGADVVEYLPDFYGEMTDAINVGHHSDRLFVRWDLRAEPRVRATQEPTSLHGHLAVADVAGEPTGYVRPGDPSSRVLVAVPADVSSLRQEDPGLARRWRLEVRAALRDLLARGWTVTDFTRSGHYELHRKGDT
ncbi:hypothetical protein [Microbacterium sp. 18062]|uniref:hypothetical protein n=1 Tax=Microbacterium sp. 18062 TaxID=2681410 RepID=UPI00135829E5|nr:hypothetical protein [Microbacterium sp. 18062]